MFKKKSNEPLSLLSGTVIKTEKNYYYIKNGFRVLIPTKTVVESWNFYRIVKTTEEAVQHLPVAGRLGFREGTLVYCIADASYYFVANKKLVHVTDMQLITDHGYRLRDALLISKKERDLHEREE